MKRLLGLLLLMPMTACMVGPDYVRPPVDEPPAYLDEPPSGESIVNLPWWELFDDPVLRGLIVSALQNNRDLRAAVARIDAAAAQVGIVRADLYPRIFYGGDGVVSGTSTGNGETSSEGTLFLDSLWHIDLWGRYRRANEAALQDLLATEESFRGVTISLVAAVASSYLVLRDLDNRLLISEQTVEVRQKNYDIILARFEGGSVTEIDLNQATIQLAEAQASVQAFKRLRRQTENAISVLLGEPPMHIERGRPLDNQLSTPGLPAGLPSELLDRRPDILVAERQLHAQTARIGVAKSLLFPQFDLTASLGSSFANISTGFFNLGAQILGPLFNSGENLRIIDAEVARTQELLNNYEQSILNAYREVEDALIGVSTYEEELQARMRQVAAAESAAKLAWIRYEDGVTSYQEVLETQRQLFGSQLSESETQQLRLNSVVDLYEALGGGWYVEPDSTSAADSTLSEPTE